MVCFQTVAVDGGLNFWLNGFQREQQLAMLLWLVSPESYTQSATLHA